MTTRKIGNIGQGVDEAIRYEIAATPAPVTVVAVTVYDDTAGGSDVSSAVLDGATVIQNGRMVLPLLRNLQERHVYRVEVRYSDGASTLEPFFVVVGER